MAGNGPGQPMSVEEIVQHAENFEYNPLVPFKHWSRSAGTIIKEAEIYENEGNEQQAYLLLFRHARLVLDNLPNHPEARSRDNEVTLQQLRKDVLRNFPKLEKFKPRINKRYEYYRRFLEDRRQAKEKHERLSSLHQGPIQPHRPGGSHRPPPLDPVLTSGQESLTAADNRDLAVKLAHKEIHRRATARKATRQAGISEEEEHGRRTAGLWGDWEATLTSNDQSIDQDTLTKQMQSVRSQVNGSAKTLPRHRDSLPLPPKQPVYFQYPSVPSQKAHDGIGHQLLPLTQSTESPPLPRRPPKEPDVSPDHCDLPRIPSKEEMTVSDTQELYNTTPPQQDLQPSTFAFKPSAYLENGTPLRTIFLPPNLEDRFLSIALPNTRANLETCGILCGTLISNALFISKLVIPEQESTSDTCETVNESDLFDYVDGEDLMVLGWIHTHPTQTCFMSSRDLHTHCGYQVMMPESIAIVCAPSKGE
ncbi:MAG: hypothetical protein Q9174_000212 [Haloplaca sp. 1 TL-2023]